MAAIEARLAKLEAMSHRSSGPKRQIVLRCDRGITEDEQQALFDREGIVPGDGDIILRLITTYEGDGKPRAAPTLVGVHPLAT